MTEVHDKAMARTTSKVASILIYLFPPALLWCLVHEGCHAIAALLQGCKITSFKPYPHERDGDWVFGWMSYSWRGKRPSEAFVTLAPYMFDLAYSLAAASAALCIGSLGGVVLALSILLPLTNTAVALSGAVRGGNVDLAKECARPYVPYIWAYYVTEAVACITALWILLW